MEFERGLILEGIQCMKRSGCMHLYGTDSMYFENKNSKKSLSARKQANQLFARKNHDEKVHEEIWKLYTKSIAYASSESEELSAGHANRSALLLHLKKYKECLLEINRALKTTNSSTLKVKLYCRQSECYLALQDGKERVSLKKANFCLSKIDNDRERTILKETIEKTEKSIKAYVPDCVEKEKKYEISCENTAFRMNYNKKYGNHLVADRDIHVGELIYIDKFYLTTMNSAKFYAYCSHCLAISWATIPCDQCSSYMYCSEKCKQEAWQKYHDIECAVKFARNPKIRDDYYMQLGLRALIMGFKETGSILKLKELTSEIDKCTDFEKKVLAKDGNFSNDSFRTLYSLSYSKALGILRIWVPKVLNILIAIARNTDIFGDEFKYTNNTDLMNNEKTIFVASLFTRLSSICLLNAFEVASANLDCDKRDDFFDCMIEYCCHRGMNLSLFTSLINHSCDNNVDKFHTNDGRVVYYALQPIKKNSQIFSSYYCKFFNMTKQARQQRLYGFFEFHCDCVACKNNWPTLIESCPHTHTGLASAMLRKHDRTLAKLSLGKKRYSTKTIRTFMQDTELLLKSLKRPATATDYFLHSLCQLIEHRYFLRLHIPKTCKNNLNK